jgi:mono/diheme cytochrome c family protein
MLHRFDMTHPCSVLRIVLLCLGSAAACSTAHAQADFAREVWPILAQNCLECHGERRQEGGLRIDSPASWKKGGTSGSVVIPHSAATSELVRRISLPSGDAEAMPPRGSRLTSQQISAIRRWIDGGAVWPAGNFSQKHWSLAPVARPAVPMFVDAPPTHSPSTQAASAPRNAIDLFVERQRIAAGLSSSPEANRVLLARRIALDLIGLPPTPEQVDDFLSESGPDALERWVDRLLASDQMGIRWARPWLDYARYADSHGFQRDDFRDLWAYRDWVVDAFNADLPFDQFTIEQLAGDLLPQATPSQHIATGFNRSAPCNVEAGSDPEETRINQVHDRVHTLGAVWLGATLECCQCHDHKYDPLTMRDYYGLFAIFNSTVIEAQRSNAQVPGSIRFLGAALELDVLQDLRPPLAEPSPSEVNAAPEAPNQATSAQPVRRPAKKAPQPAATRATTQVMRELDSPRPTMIFLRGDFRTPGEAVERSFPSAFALSFATTPLDQSARAASVPNRLELARWLVSDDHPRTARVVVNRWWGELMGRPLVSTPEDFGVKGERPSHPELLDWLACEFRERGWSTKRLLREIVLSSTYRQTSNAPADQRAKDDNNVGLARAGRWRMDAEMIRDNALAISGLLSRHKGGPPIRPYQPEGLWVKVGGERYDYVVSPEGERHRRGLYVVWKRAAPYPSFMNFDATNRMACRVSRSRTNTPLQALTLLNDPVYVEAAMGLAERMHQGHKMLDSRSESEDTIDTRIAYGFRLAVTRPPSATEAATLRNLYDQQLSAALEEPANVATVWDKRPLPTNATRQEMSAWFAVATTLLNLDETITRR